MKRLKNVSGIFLALVLGLCVISTPALAEHGWIEDPPQTGKGTYDLPPRPGKTSSSSDDLLYPAGSYTSVLMEISYRLVEFLIDDIKTSPTIQSSPVGGSNEPTKVR